MIKCIHLKGKTCRITHVDSIEPQESLKIRETFLGLVRERDVMMENATLLALKMEEIVSMSQRRQMGARNCKKQGS